MMCTCAALAGALLTVACGRDAASDATAIATWSVDSQPMLTIGRDASEEGGVILERITGATRLPDGSLLVADLGNAPLTLFDSSGRPQRVVSRAGKGPGEITYLARLFRCGNRIYTYDIDGRRISEFSPAGEYLGEFRFEMPAGQQAPYASACGPDGRFLHLGWGARGVPKAGYHRDTVPVWITATAAGAPALIDSVPASERWGQTYEGRIVGSRPLPLGRQPRVAVGPNAFYVATGDAFEVLVFDSTGAARGAYRVSDSVPAVTAADVKDYVEAQIAEAGERERVGIEREYAGITFPERHGAVTGLLVDAEGLIWLRAYAPPTATNATWHVLAPDGRALARIALPRRLELFEIGRDYLLGREVDATEGVPVVRLLRLNRDAR